MHVRFGTGFAHRFTSLDWFANINNGMMWTIKIMCAIWIISYARIVRRSGSCIAPAAEKIVGIPRQQLFLLTLAMLSVAEKRNSLDALNALSHYLVYFDWIIFRFPSKLSRWPQISRRLLEFLIDRRRSLFENMSRFWSWSEYSEHLSIEFGMGKRIETSAAHRLFRFLPKRRNMIFPSRTIETGSNSESDYYSDYLPFTWEKFGTNSDPSKSIQREPRKVSTNFLYFSHKIQRGAGTIHLHQHRQSYAHREWIECVRVDP